MPHTEGMRQPTQGQARMAMTGDTLISLMTAARSTEDAAREAWKAPRAARMAAADLLYIEAGHYSMDTIVAAIVREARA